MKVLIVDDEPHIRQMMRLTLEATGYAVDEAANGEDGLARFGDGSAHAVVLLDQKMPGIDGLQTLKRLKERAPAACVVIVTAFGSIELAVDAMKLGATDFVRKPMTPETLRASVAAALAGRVPQPGTRAIASTERTTPRIETLTLNGFRIVRESEPTGAARGEHVFRVTHLPGPDCRLTVTINPDAVARVARLTGRTLEPGGAFWRMQAERRAAAVLWSEGRPPDTGRLTVDDVTRQDIDIAAAWEDD